MYQLVIIGGGPAGIAAGVYAARKKLHTALVAESFGGQSITSDNIQNWIGSPSVSGLDLAEQLEKHLREYDKDLDIIEGERVTTVTKQPDGMFRLLTSGNRTLETQAILMATGSRRRKLDIPGEAQFEGKGVVYCSTCDAPLFGDKTVAVVGGGNAGVEGVIDLITYAKKIYLLDRSGTLKADPVTQEKALASDKVERVSNVTTLAVVGDQFVTGLKYKENVSGEEKVLPVDGVFVEIGAIPNGDIVASLVKLNERGEIVVDHRTQQSSDPRIWAVGDVSDVLYKQNNISAGDAVKAVLNIYDTLVKK
jgi:alkyl hydroperoxide reductase subunit F